MLLLGISGSLELMLLSPSLFASLLSAIYLFLEKKKKNFPSYIVPRVNVRRRGCRAVMELNAKYVGVCVCT